MSCTSDDGTGFSKNVDDEAVEAAQGEITAEVTHLNADSDDDGLPLGPKAVEVYLPVKAGSPKRVVGVFEVYLPYAPIAADVNAGLGALYRDLAAGLGALYIVLFLISYSVSRRLRQQVRENKFLAEHDPLTNLPNRSTARCSTSAPRTRSCRRCEVIRARRSPSSTWTGSRRSTTPWGTTAATSS